MKVIALLLYVILSLQTSTSENQTNLPSIPTSSVNVNTTYISSTVTSVDTTESTTATPIAIEEVAAGKCGDNKVALKLGQFSSITSPNYPGDYSIFSKCTWIFTAYEDADLHIECPEIYLSWFASVTITDGDSSNRYGCFFCSDPISIYRSFKSQNVKFEFANCFFFSAKGFSCKVTAAKSVDCACGESNMTRIVGGEKARANEFPWMASIVRRGEYRAICGGSLLNSQFVVTAAHCTRNLNQLLDVELGHLNASIYPSTNMKRKVLQIIRHPSYNSSIQDYDVSLLRIQEVLLSLYSNIRPICLPNSTFNDYAGKEVVVAGFGTTASGGSISTSLLKVSLPMVSNADCRRMLQMIITDRMMCAGIEGKDSCQGDSGGPVMLYTGKYYELVGLVSFGIGCGGRDLPGVNTRVTAVVDWIKSKVAEGETCARPVAKRDIIHPRT